MHGGTGRDVTVPVPPGTMVWARDEEESAPAGVPVPLAEVLKPGHRVLVARGGKGGRGNLAFKTARNTAPVMAERGEAGQGTASPGWLAAWVAVRAHAPNSVTSPRIPSLAPFASFPRAPSISLSRPLSPRSLFSTKPPLSVPPQPLVPFPPPLPASSPERWLRLELRLVAEVGLVGAPNAGKSTLLGVLSAARPKVAAYPFTTLTPNLGVCGLGGASTVFADVPGLIAGAAAGAGLGHEFLRHCRRCRVLVHVLDGAAADPAGDAAALRAELELYAGGELTAKPLVVAVNKQDLTDARDYFPDVRAELCGRYGLPADCVLPVSAVTGEGVEALVWRVRGMLRELDEVEGARWALPPASVVPGPRPPQGAGVELAGLVARGRDGGGIAPAERGEEAGLWVSPSPQAPFASDERRESRRPPATATRAASEINAARLRDFELSSDLRGPRRWFVRGAGVERLARMTDWSFFEAARRFQHAMRAAGVEAALVGAGVKPGDAVVIADLEFAWAEDRGEGALYGAWLQAHKDAGTPYRGAARWPHPSA